MNYYPFHLGDYAAHTAHLEPMEDLAYRRMLDLYYRTEAPLPVSVEDIARLIRMRDYAAFVRDVLNEFFEPCEEGWRHGRCDTEIASFKAMVEGGRKGAAKRWAKGGHSHPIATIPQPQCQPEPEPEPEPKEEKTARKRATPVGAARPDSVSEDVWRDWTALRKAKRAPVSPTVVAEAEREAMKAGMTLEAFLRVWCARGSQGLQAEWLKPHEVGTVKSANSVSLKRETDAFMAQQRERDKVLADPAEQAKIAALIASRRPRAAA